MGGERESWREVAGQWQRRHSEWYDAGSQQHEEGLEGPRTESNDQQHPTQEDAPYYTQLRLDYNDAENVIVHHQQLAAEMSGEVVAELAGEMVDEVVGELAGEVMGELTGEVARELVGELPRKQRSSNAQRPSPSWVKTPKQAQ